MQSPTIVSMKPTSFYLHSKQNRGLYSSVNYPLTYSLDWLSIEHRLTKQPTYVKHFKFTFFLLLLFILISSIFFQVHIYSYNSFFGPFHLNSDEFVQHVKNFENGLSWFKRIEYVQIELGENSIRHPTSTYNTIRKYSDPFTRQKHSATYKKLTKPDIYVKLPTRLQRNFHVRHPFHFPSYSIRTLKCIVKRLQSNSQSVIETWPEKAEYVTYINEEYAKNSTLFNILVLTKCGILIGYLYRPLYDKAFLPNREFTFNSNDIALDVTRPYFRFPPLVLCSLMFAWLFLKSLFYLLIYLSNLIRFKLFNKIGLISFPLTLSADVIEELWLLNLEGSPAQQLLQLDELMQATEHKFDNRLFIVKNDLQQFCVVLLKTKLDEQPVDQTDFSPFFIFPASGIRKIMQYGGICYGNDLSWIPWPSTMPQEANYSEWLHEELMEVSEDYRNMYEHRLRNEEGNMVQSALNSGLYPYDSAVTRTHRQRSAVMRETPDEIELKQLIREEENVQRLKREREQYEDLLFQQKTPASPQFIARFRKQQQLRQNRIDAAMVDQELTCMVCLSEFQLEDAYERWPCPSTTSHIFHVDCMLKMLRMKNTCPICRHPAEPSPGESHPVSQFLSHLIF